MREIIVEGVTKSFGSRQVLSDISFFVNKGEIHGFLGPNGAGKTTTMKIITNLLQADQGKVEINSQAIDQKNKMTLNQVGFLLDEPPLYGDMSVMEYLTFVAKLKQVPKNQISQNLKYCIDALDLSSVLDRSIENISKGFKQRVGIAQALVHRPSILILDEPTVGLDPKSVVEIRNLILKLKADHTIILSSHLLHEMSLVCDQVTIIKDGKIIESDSLQNLRNKISARKTITIKVLNQNNDFDNYLKTLPGLLELSVEKNHEETIYKFTRAQSEDIRSDILKNAVSCNAEPVFFEQKELSLEDIFMQITEDQK